MTRAVWLTAAAIASFVVNGAEAQKKRPPVISPPPIVRVPDEHYGAWTVSWFATDTWLATTPNDAGSAFGAVCSKKGCSTFINPQITCDQDATYPALVNAPSAAFAATLTCIHFGKIGLLVFSEDKAILDAMSIGGNIGVAFPMQSGEFKVSRFSLTGGMRAYARASQLAKPAAAASGVSDSRL